MGTARGFPDSSRLAAFCETATCSGLILETMISHLGFTARIEVETDEEHGESLQVHMDDAEALVGNEAERLEDLQYLVNRLLQQKQPDAPRVKVDVAHFRERFR